VAEPDRGLSQFRPIRLRKAADEVVAAIVDGIRGGLWEPGDLLPRARDLAARLDVSPTTLREATNLLERAGVVTIKRGNGGGVVVATRSVPARILAELEALRPSDIRSVLETRRVMETSAAVMAGSVASEDDFHHLDELVLGLHDLLGTPRDFLVLEVRFHVKIAEVTRNALIHTAVKDILARLSVIQDQLPVGHIALEKGIKNQRATLDALRSRKEHRILEAIDEHLGSVEEHFLGERFDEWGRASRQVDSRRPQQVQH
jgi:GntR family transcriptional repressor for pyruvate dehydrogenase complex